MHLDIVFKEGAWKTWPAYTHLPAESPITRSISYTVVNLSRRNNSMIIFGLIANFISRDMHGEEAFPKGKYFDFLGISR